MDMNWQIIFQLSKVNGGIYLGDELPPHNWDWPTKTWFQERLRGVREKQWFIERKLAAENVESS